MKRLVKIFVLLLLPALATAQQSKVDSVIWLINQVKGNVLDSSTYSSVYKILERTTLKDSQINAIETAGLRFQPGERKDWDYYVTYAILTSLINTDPNKAIDYGKLQIEKLEKNKSPYSSYTKSRILTVLRIPFRNGNRFEEGLKFYTQKLQDYKNDNDSIGIAQCFFVLGGFYRINGLTDLAIYNVKKSLSYIDTLKEGYEWWINNNTVLGFYYLRKGDKSESLRYSTIAYNQSLKNERNYSGPALIIAEVMLLNNQLDSAAFYIYKAKEDPDNNNSKDFLPGILQTEAQYKMQSGALNEADSLLKQCQQLIKINNIAVNSSAGIIAPDYFLALVKIKQNKLNEAIDLLYKDIERLKNIRLDIQRDYKLIAELYSKLGKFDKAAATYAIYNAKRDSLIADQDKYRAFNFEAEQQMSEKELSIAQLESQNKISSLYRNFSIGIAGLLLLLVSAVYYRFKSKQKANIVLEKTLKELKATQNQLIQSEKLASLGELTAGIAHEIQNPLNFVNNFAELSVDLAKDINSEIRKPEMDKDYLEELLTDLTHNQEKINLHGKRASSIVKGMLEHSRASTGVKELTDINKLCDEYFRLAYHGLRAKDKDFNCELISKFDETLPKIEIIPQDVGRVVLNLINNAFYAVIEQANKKRSGNFESSPNVENLRGYKPMVTVTTQKTDNGIEIRVKDNGTGMPESVKEKIFQPFFTTKPTGSGTGLGLSLAYDIITKGHSGTLKVESKEDEGSEFVIFLPILN